MRLFMHRVVHLVLTGVMLGLAIAFSDGHDSFAGITSFDWMAAHMTEPHWGIACAVPGIVGTATALSRSWRVRAAAAVILAAAHGGFAVALMLGNSHAVGSIFCIANAALGLFLAFSTAHFGARGQAHLGVYDPPR